MKVAVLCLLFGLICANPIEQSDDEVACAALFSDEVSLSRLPHLTLD